MHPPRERLPLWARRLFRQKTPDEQPRYGSELGLANGEGDFEIRDRHRFAAIESAVNPRQRVDAAIDYLKKARKNALRAHDATGDPEILNMIDDACERLTVEIAATTAAFVDEIGVLGYDPDLGYPRRPPGHEGLRPDH